MAAPLAAQRDSAAAASDGRCLACHTMPNLGYRDSAGAAARNFSLNAGAFRGSAHGALHCAQCHPQAVEFPHPAAMAATRVSCDGDCHATDSLGRPYTHAREAADLAASIHGAGHDPDNPTCLSCHGAGNPHAIATLKGAPPAARMAVCANCHADREMMARHGVPTDAVASYERSFHYKAIRFGATGTAVCTDCHTAHHVLPAGDPRSTVARANLTRTCGQSNCHAGAQMNFASSGANHLDLRVDKSPVLFFEEKFFYLLTAGTMVMLLVGIVLDVQRKFNWLVLARAFGRVLARRARRVSRHLGWVGPALGKAGRAAFVAMRRVLYD
ncbi:MAG: hypothetical protein KGL38_04935 [Gemmatimonadota bacterium]|nr:hypothetical protein [Gemmatimonadota bacterium]